MLRSLHKSLAVAAAFCAVSTIMFEIAARLLFQDAISQWRLQPFGGPEIQFMSRGAIGVPRAYTAFAPNAVIRVVSYYPDSENKVTKEYDCAFNSDQNGFISNEGDYQESEILLLGDSFTAGWGGCEWVPRLASDVRSRIYSAAINGTGPITWDRIVSDLASIREPRRLLVIFITDDFFRGDVVHPKAQIECLKGTANCSRQFVFPVTDDMADVAAQRYADRVASVATAAAAEGNADRISAAKLRRQLLDYLPATRMLVRTLRGQAYREEDVFRRSVKSIVALSVKYDLKLLWVNEKREVRSDARDTRLVREALHNAGLRATSCHIPLSGFLPRDNHPNKVGYDILKGCVERLVRDWSGG